MTPSTNVKILVHMVTVVIAVLGKHVGVNEDELHLIRETFFHKLKCYINSSSDLTPGKTLGRHVTPGKTRVGVVSPDSVSAWLLLPGGSTLNRTRAWLKSSPPGQVFAVMRLDDKKKVGVNMSVVSAQCVLHNEIDESFKILYSKNECVIVHR